MAFILWAPIAEHAIGDTRKSDEQPRFGTVHRERHSRSSRGVGGVYLRREV